MIENCEKGSQGQRSDHRDQGQTD